MGIITHSKVRVLSVLTASLMFVFTGLPGLSLFEAHAAAPASYVTLSSFSGHPASSLIVSGGNYQANETISIVATEGSAAVEQTTAKASASGQFSANVMLPAKLAQGNVSFAATGETSGLTANNSYYVAPFSPSLTLGSTETTPFGTVSVSGSGYEPNEPVILNFAGTTTTVNASATGALSAATINTPNVPAGSYTIVGVGQNSGASATGYEYINGFYASASPSSYYVLPNTALSFNGSGFAPGETVTVTDGTSGTVLSTFKASATGSFTAAGSFLVPASDGGMTKNFVLTGSLSKATTSVSTTIGQYYPNVAPSSYYVLPGTTLSFNGSGFAPNEAINIYSGTTKVSSATADAKGNLSLGGTISIPSSEAGTTQSFTLVGQTSQGSGTASVQVGSYNPVASPSGYYLLPGSNLTFSGSGYAPDEVVAVFSGTTSLGSFNTTATGTFAAAGTVNINYSQAGTSASYKLVGSVSKTAVNLTVGVGQLNTMLTPSSYYVLPFAPFSVTGTGFAPGETVTLKNGTTVLGTAVSNAKGTAIFPAVVLPASTATSVTLSATGAISNAPASASIGMGTYNPNVTSSSYYVKPGSVISLSGSGYAPNEPVTITAGATTIKTTANALGSFSTPFTVPFGSTKSTIAIVSTGSLSTATTTTTLTLAPYVPQVSPSTYYATPGTPVTFSGSGFVPSEAITVSLNGTQVGTETADAKGNLTSTGSYMLPYGTKAVYTIAGVTSGGSVTISVGLAQFYAGLSLSSYYGDGGSMVTATGSGFAPNELIRIQSGTNTLAKLAANAMGNFTTSIQIPYVAAGKLVITASGSNSGAVATTGYTTATVYNSVGLGNYVVAPGAAVNITGSGFIPNEPVTVSGDRTTGTYTFDASASGSLNNSGFILPASLAAGNLTLTITGTESFTVHTITLYVQ